MSRDIINPMAQTVLTLVVNDQMQIKLDSKLDPATTVKILMSAAMDVQFNLIAALSEANKPKLSAV